MKIKTIGFLIATLFICTNLLANPQVPLSQKNMSDTDILNWSKNTAVDIKTYNFVNLGDHFKKIAVYFTPFGKFIYLHSLDKSGEIDLVKSKRLLVEAKPNGTPRILKQGINKDVYYWQITVPLLVTYQSPNTKLDNSTMMNMLIVRCDNNKFNVCISKLDESHKPPLSEEKFN